MLNTLIALIFLSIIIMVHELGHFLVGKSVGIYAEEFSIGMGPRLLKYEGKETVYSLRAFPIGGYVKFLGEDEAHNDPKAFNNAAIWKRFVVIAAGALMNFVFAIVLLSILFSTHGVYTPAPVVNDIIEDSPATEAGIQKGDKIVEVGNVDIEDMDSNDAVIKIRDVLTEHGANQVAMKVLRDESYIDTVITPRYDENYEQYMIGVEFGYDFRKLGFGKAFTTSVSKIGQMSVMMLKVLGNLAFKREGLNDVMGPVGIVGEIGKAAKAGAVQLMELGIIISLNLGILNLIPFPALDGGRLLLLIVEGIRGKPMDREKEGLINLVGFALLLILMIVVTFRDITG